MDTLLAIIFWFFVIGIPVQIAFNIAGYIEGIRSGDAPRRKPPGFVWRLLGASDHPR